MIESHFFGKIIHSCPEWITWRIIDWSNSKYCVFLLILIFSISLKLIDKRL